MALRFGRCLLLKQRVKREQGLIASSGSLGCPRNGKQVNTLMRAHQRLQPLDMIRPLASRRSASFGKASREFSNELPVSPETGLPMTQLRPMGGFHDNCLRGADSGHLVDAVMPVKGRQFCGTAIPSGSFDLLICAFIHKTLFLFTPPFTPSISCAILAAPR